MCLEREKTKNAGTGEKKSETRRATSEDIFSFAIRRGFFWPSYEIYGGLSGFYDLGPNGARLRDNILSVWKRIYAVEEGMLEISGPAIGPGDVYRASGHLSEFTDYITSCEKCGEVYRADHILEGVVENPSSLGKKELWDALQKNGVVCEKCGGNLTEPEPFNLMFKTYVGPGKGREAYLRPETAQAMFVAFNHLSQQARRRLPFGVIQIGRGYRNEISPRQGLLRLREFHMAEAEVFFHPDKKVWESDREEELFNQTAVFVPQTGGEKTTTFKNALETGMIRCQAVAYFMALTHRFLVEIGVDPQRLRFRQHLQKEMAHYARDCWDAEVLLSYGWVEIVGIADRGDYDLSGHIRESGEDLGVFVNYPEPKRVCVKRIVPDLKKLGPVYRNRAKKIAAALEKIGAEEIDRWMAEKHMRGDGEGGGRGISVVVDGEEIMVGEEFFSVEEKEVTVAGEKIVPHVVEPSYGIDRIMYAVLEHNLEIEKKDEEEYRVLHIPPHIAPITTGVFPLVARDGLDTIARKIDTALRKHGIKTYYDESGSIGRRYARMDEIGTPWCVTVDYETPETGDVTVRERDTRQQTRVKIGDLVDFFREKTGL